MEEEQGKQSVLLHSIIKNKVSLLRGSMFIKYPKVTAADATQFYSSVNEQRNNILNNGIIAGFANQAKKMEELLNEASKKADFDKQVNAMADKIIERMASAAEAGLEAGAGDGGTIGLTRTAGSLSFRSSAAAANQALSVYNYGLKKGRQYTTINGAIGGGDYNNHSAGSAYYYLQKLNNGSPVEKMEIIKAATYYRQISNLNGEILERVGELAAQASFNAGSEIGAAAIDDLISAIGTVDVSVKTQGQDSRTVTINIGDKEAVVEYSSQGKADFSFINPDDKSSITFSAKSSSNMSREISLLDNGTLIGLLAGNGGINKKAYSALTVYTGGAVYSSKNMPDNFKKMIIYQALSGITEQKNDLAQFMIFQVGNADAGKHFKVVSIYSLVNSQLNEKDITQWAKVSFSPDTLPMGANAIRDKNGSRTEETLQALFNATVSVKLKRNFLQALYNS